MKLPMIMILSCLSFTFFSCSSDDDFLDGGPCDYRQYEGVAMIIAIEDAPADGNNCPNNPKRVIYAFTPNDSSATETYLFPNEPDSLQYFEISGGINPSQSWIENNEMEIGKEYTCLREEITQGTCTPIIFTFTDPALDMDGACD